MRTVGRIIWVPIAFVLAVTACLFVVVTLGLERATAALHDRAGTPDGVVDIIVAVQSGVLLATGLTLLPALAVVVVGEVARIRSALYYVAGGGLSMAVVPLLARAAPDVTGQPIVWQVLATAGFAGGFVYWLLAGRSA